MLKYQRHLILTRALTVAVATVAVGETLRMHWRRRLLNSLKILKPKGGL